MTLTIEAVYEKGVLTLKQPLTLADGTLVHLAVTPVDEDYDPLDAVFGVCTEGPDVSLAERHDEILYGGLVHKEIKQP